MSQPGRGAALFWGAVALNGCISLLLLRAGLAHDRKPGPPAAPAPGLTPAQAGSEAPARAARAARRARPVALAADSCDRAKQALRDRLARIETALPPLERPVEVFEKSAVNPALTSAVRSEVTRFLAARSLPVAQPQVECHGDACKIGGFDRGLWAHLRSDPWFRQRFLGANVGDSMYLRLSDQPGRPAGEVAREIVAAVKQRVDADCAATRKAPARKSHFLFVLRAPTLGDAYELVVETEGRQPEFEACVVELGQRQLQILHLDGVIGRKATVGAVL